MTYALTKFEVARSKSGEVGAFTRKYKVTQTVAQDPLHHVTYAGVKFEVATSIKENSGYNKTVLLLTY